MQKTRRLPGGGKHHRNPLNVAVDSHAHPVMPLIKGILNAQDRKSTRQNSSHGVQSRMPSSA